MKFDLTSEMVEDGFMQRLLHYCEAYGIDTTDWDGDDDQVLIVARGIRTTIDRAVEDANNLLRRALPYVDTCPDLYRAGGDELAVEIKAHIRPNTQIQRAP